MPSAENAPRRLKIGHVLFLDIVGYSKLLMGQQSEALQQLNRIVAEAEAVREAERNNHLILLPAGDGMALVFTDSLESPVEAALQISRALRSYPALGVRMGIHSGPVSQVTDVAGRANITGTGINMAQRVMDCGDAGHILVSRHVAEDLESYGHWQPLLHDLGQCEVKHGTKVHIFNLYKSDKDAFGNSERPQKFKRPTTRRKQTHRPIVYLIPILALIIPAIIFAPKLLRERKSGNVNETSAANKSIAVLPFENLSSDKENSYFADGIQDEILTRLSKIADLKVISRTSTQKFKSAPADLPEIAKKLGVTNILEGSVQRSSDQVRISVQLINALTDSHLWAETYDRKLSDVFQLESDLAQKIATSLEAKLTGREKKEISARGTSNTSAYDAFLHALALSNRQGSQDLDELIQFARQAVELDPNYAQAWCLLAVGESQKYFYPEHTVNQLERARVAAETAGRLAPDTAEGPAATGAFKYYCLRDYEGALAQFQLVRERAPNDAHSLTAMGLVKRRQGHIEESIALQRESAQLDPLNEDTWVNIGRGLRALRRFDEARRMFERAEAIAPNDAEIPAQRAETYVAQGDLSTAQNIMEPLTFGPTDRGFGAKIQLLVFRRRFGEVEQLIRSTLDHDDIPPLFVAIGHANLGQACLTKGDRVGAQSFFLQSETELKKLRDAGDNGPLLREILLNVAAHLGRRDEVQTIADSLLEAARGDAWQFPRTEEAVARAYVALGDFDRALPLIEHALRTPSVEGLTTAYLRIDPSWDPIRQDARFQKLCQEPNNQ